MPKFIFTFTVGLFFFVSSATYAFDEPFIESVKLDVERYNISNDIFKRAVAKALVFSRWKIDQIEKDRIFASRDYKKKQVLLKSYIRFDGKLIHINMSQKYWKHKAGKYKRLSDDIFTNIQQMTLANVKQDQINIVNPVIPDEKVDGKLDRDNTIFDVSSYKHSAADFRKTAVLALSKTKWRIRKIEQNIIYASQTISGDEYAVRVEHKDDEIIVRDTSSSRSAKRGWLDNIKRYYIFYAEWDSIAVQVASGALGNKIAKAKTVIRPYKDVSLEEMASTLVIDLHGMKSEADIRTLVARNLHVLKWRVKEAGKNYLIADYDRKTFLKEEHQFYEIEARFHDGKLFLLVTNQSDQMRYNWLRTIRDRIETNIKLHLLGLG